MESSRRLSVLAVCLLVAGAAAQQEVASSCPVPNGFFADSVQCDKYYACVDNVLTEKLCPDGMAFNDLNHRIEKCDFIYQADCETRPELQTPQATPNCPRANGYYAHPTPGRCSEYFHCSEGKDWHNNCPAGLVFSLLTGTCVWPDQSGRTDSCTAKNVLNFTCPVEPPHVAVAHPRYADPADCQYFYVCIDGRTPRHNGCKFGEVFNSKIGACDQAKEVPDCANYYFDYFRNYFDNLPEGEIPAPDTYQAAVNSGFPVPKVAKRVRVSPSGAIPVGPDGIRRRRPTVEGAIRPTIVAPFDGPKNTRVVGRLGVGITASPAFIAGTRRRARPSLALSRRGTTPAPTTTTPPPPPAEYADEEYYYDDYPAA